MVNLWRTMLSPSREVKRLCIILCCGLWWVRFYGILSDWGYCHQDGSRSEGAVVRNYNGKHWTRFARMLCPLGVTLGKRPTNLLLFFEMIGLDLGNPVLGFSKFEGFTIAWKALLLTLMLSSNLSCPSTQTKAILLRRAALIAIQRSHTSLYFTSYNQCGFFWPIYPFTLY